MRRTRGEIGFLCFALAAAVWLALVFWFVAFVAAGWLDFGRAVRDFGCAGFCSGAGFCGADVD
jgi:hypothetical protein